MEHGGLLYMLLVRKAILRHTSIQTRYSVYIDGIKHLETNIYIKKTSELIIESKIFFARGEFKIMSRAEPPLYLAF